MNKIHKLECRLELRLKNKGCAGSTELHREFSGETSHQSISNALSVLVANGRVKKETVQGHRGYRYSIATKPKVEATKASGGDAPDVVSQKYIAKYDDRKGAWSASTVSNESAAEKPQIETYEEIVERYNDSAQSSAAFTAYWTAHGPFSGEYWKGLPKTGEVESYLAAHRDPAWRAWCAAIKYAKTGKFA